MYSSGGDWVTPRWQRARKSVLASALAVLAAAGIAATFGVSATSAAIGSKGPGLANNQCAVLMGWWKTAIAGIALQPYASYGTLTFQGANSSAPPLQDVAFTIDQDYPYAAQSNWVIYGPQLGTLPVAALGTTETAPSPGSVNPFSAGTPQFATNRHYQILITADNVNPASLPPSLASAPNRITFPAQDQKIKLTQRVYSAFKGYTRAGTLPNSNWPVVKAWDVQTGAPIPCAEIQPARALVQKLTPFDTVGLPGPRNLPGSLLALFPGQILSGKKHWPPRPSPSLLDFFRAPANATGLPGGVYPIVDNCSNYLMARLDPRRIGVWRVPLVPTFQSTNPSHSAVYTPTDVGAYNYYVIGNAQRTFRPHSPYNYALGQEDIKQDATGGATFVVWPAAMRPAERKALFAKAKRNHWNLLRGNINGPVYADEIWLRMNGTNHNYPFGPTPILGFRSGAPCMNGPQSVLSSFPDTSNLTQVPPGTPYNSLGQQWAVTSTEMGTAAPQGVMCNFAQFMGTNCLVRLKQHIAQTGGSYSVP